METGGGDGDETESVTEGKKVMAGISASLTPDVRDKENKKISLPWRRLLSQQQIPHGGEVRHIW